jgi:biopolymer transport protein ExbD
MALPFIRYFTRRDSKVMVPITPMLDMTFQLLFFFLLNYHPTAAEGQMDLALPTEKPKVSQTNESRPIENALSEDPEKLDEPPEVTVIVKSVKGDDSERSGQISAISVQLKEGTTPIELPEGGTVKELMKELQEHLAKVRETVGNKTDIMMKGDRSLKWQYVVKVRDACEKAGFSNAHFSAPSDL